MRAWMIDIVNERVREECLEAKDERMLARSNASLSERALSLIPYG